MQCNSEWKPRSPGPLRNRHTLHTLPPPLTDIPPLQSPHTYSGPHANRQALYSHLCTSPSTQRHTRINTHSLAHTICLIQTDTRTLSLPFPGFPGEPAGRRPQCRACGPCSRRGFPPARMSRPDAAQHPPLPVCAGREHSEVTAKSPPYTQAPIQTPTPEASS